MTSSLSKLLSIASAPFCSRVNMHDEANLEGALVQQLLSKRNGFFAFESALRVFPTETVGSSWGIGEWNSEDLWKEDYAGIADHIFCFAEDVFGGQFCLSDSGVARFDPECGALEAIAGDLEEWASKLLSDYDGMAGYGAAHKWQAANGPLPLRFRLMPKLPFVLGGKAELANLVAIDSVRLMKNMGNLAKQIHDLPDGTKIKFEIGH